MFTPDSQTVVKVRERNGIDLFVILVADLANADRTGQSWNCSPEMTLEVLDRKLRAQGLTTEAITALVERAQQHFRMALQGHADR